MSGRPRAAVIAAHPLAAQAGADMFRRGGNAVDATVAAAFALAVVDPQNCGVGGHGGAMLVQPATQAEVTLIDFNTSIADGFEAQSLTNAKHSGPFSVSGASVSIPAVIAGLERAHRTFGKLSFATAVEPAISMAHDGHPTGADLAHSLAWAVQHHPALSPEFKAVFFAGEKPLVAGLPLKQPELARTLARIAQNGANAFYRGPLAAAICACVTGNGGLLSVDDLASVRPDVGTAQSTAFQGAAVYGPRRDTTGYGTLCAALADIDSAALGANRSAKYAQTCVKALRAAWAKRRQETTPIAAGHTTHLCASDGSGMLVSTTFTHGPTWFGSGLIVPGTGILLNAGANLFVRSRRDGGLYAMHNMSPVIVQDTGGARHAIGSPGGSKIPAIVLQLIIDSVHYGLPLAEAIKLPRLSVAPDGRTEAEPGMLPAVPAELDPRSIERHEYYGPASALSLDRAGCARVAPDPRFQPGWIEL